MCTGFSSARRFAVSSISVSAARTVRRSVFMVVSPGRVRMESLMFACGTGNLQSAAGETFCFHDRMDRTAAGANATAANENATQTLGSPYLTTDAVRQQSNDPRSETLNRPGARQSQAAAGTGSLFATVSSNDCAVARTTLPSGNSATSCRSSSAALGLRLVEIEPGQTKPIVFRFEHHGRVPDDARQPFLQRMAIGRSSKIDAVIERWSACAHAG